MNPNTVKSVVLWVRLTVDKKNAFKAYCYSRGLNMTDVINDMIDQLLAQGE